MISLFLFPGTHKLHNFFFWPSSSHCHYKHKHTHTHKLGKNIKELNHAQSSFSICCKFMRGNKISLPLSFGKSSQKPVVILRGKILIKFLEPAQSETKKIVALGKKNCFHENHDPFISDIFAASWQETLFSITETFYGATKL